MVAARDIKICLVSSCGGHLRELRQLREIYERFDYFYVINDRLELSNDLVGRTLFIHHAERNLSQLVNFVEAFRILRDERPQLIITTGASPAVPFGIIGKIMGIPMVYVESCAAIKNPTLTGRIVYAFRLAELFLYQWQGLDRYYPRGQFAGPLF